VLFAMDMAGKPLTGQHGAPLRLIDPARYGYKSAKLITSITFVEEGRGSMAVDLGPYYTPGGEIAAGYDHPLDLGAKVRRRNQAGEITEY
jgi:methionine sulfoxide reductase catalytic subunit